MIIKHNIMLTTILWLWILEFGLLRKRKVASQKKKTKHYPVLSYKCYRASLLNNTRCRRFHSPSKELAIIWKSPPAQIIHHWSVRDTILKGCMKCTSGLSSQHIIVTLESYHAQIIIVFRYYEILIRY